MRNAAWLAAGGLFGAGLAMPAVIEGGAGLGVVLILLSLLAVAALSSRRKTDN